MDSGEGGFCKTRINISHQQGLEVNQPSMGNYLFPGYLVATIALAWAGSLKHDSSKELPDFLKRR